MMSAIGIKKRVEHQNLVYKEGLSRRSQVSMNFGSIRIEVSKNVFVPGPFRHNLLSKAVLKEVKSEDRVLDVGTGSGVQAILAASKSGNVLAVDINPHAVECAKANAKLNNVSSKVKVIQSDLFKDVTGKFDLIIFDPPFRWTRPRSLLERATADEGYSTLRGFFSTAKKYLEEEGRILMNFGTSADIRYFRYLIRKNGFKSRVLVQETNRSGWTYYVFRIVDRKRV